MDRALGFIEVIGLTNAVIVADTMLKAANIQMEDIEITRGMGFVIVKVSGNVGAVKAAIDSGKSLAVSFDKFVSSKIIPRPAKDLDKVFNLDKENLEDIKSKEDKKDNQREINKKEVNDDRVVEKEVETKVEIVESKPRTKRVQKEIKKDLKKSEISEQ